MKISARNQLRGKVKSIKHGPVSTEVVISVVDGVEIISVNRNGGDGTGVEERLCRLRDHQGQ